MLCLPPSHRVPQMARCPVEDPVCAMTHKESSRLEKVDTDLRCFQSRLGKWLAL